LISISHEFESSAALGAASDLKLFYWINGSEDPSI